MPTGFRLVLVAFGAALLISVPQGGKVERGIDTLIKSGASVRAA